jgi:GT2 family glycosyltransferase
MTLPDACVVIVNFNGGPGLLRCLAALQGQTHTPAVMVVDSASSDGSARAAYRQFPQFSYLPLRRNVGFGSAVNIAARRIQNPLLVLLNPDTEAEPDFIAELCKPFAAQRRLASTAATLVFEHAPTVIASAGIAVHRNGVAIDARLGEPRPVNQANAPIFGASGGAAAFRRSAFTEVGGFHDAFFLYLEDVDLAWRLRLRGWESLWTPRAVARHAYSASAGEGSPFKRRLLARNRIWSIVRTWPGELLRAHAVDLLTHDVLALAYAGSTLDGAALRGRAEALVGLPWRLCERRTIQTGRTAELIDLAGWLRPALSPRRLLELRRLTARLAAPAGA